MVRDDRLYAFIVARTSRSRSRIRRFSIHRRWLKLSAFACFLVLSAAFYGFYGLIQQASHMRVERENEILRAENANQREQLERLINRVEAVEDASRRLVEMTGTPGETQPVTVGGAGGPELLLESSGLVGVESKATYVEQALRVYEAVLRERTTMPSIWPVAGSLESGFGGRRNPFGGPGYEYHEGQDIDVPYGTPVSATANGTVVFAGWQSGYGQVVFIDHGDGISTRYGHLSQIDVLVGQTIKQGEVLGRVGSTGRSTGPHLHYEVRLNNEPVDPRDFLPGANN